MNSLTFDGLVGRITDEYQKKQQETVQPLTGTLKNNSAQTNQMLRR